MDGLFDLPFSGDGDIAYITILGYPEGQTFFHKKHTWQYIYKHDQKKPINIEYDRIPYIGFKSSSAFAKDKYNISGTKV